MSRRDPREHIDDILRSWPFDPQAVSVRLVEGRDGREVLQMRVDMGVLQLETEGRPDGRSFGESATYFDHLRAVAAEAPRRASAANETRPSGDAPSAAGDDDAFRLDEEQCAEVDREFMQYYHRRICWLALKEYRRAVRDADHTLGLMDFCKEHSPDPQWTMSHEQYRPFVLFHRTQAAALAAIEDQKGKGGAESAVNAINLGLDAIRRVFAEYEAEEQFDEDELVKRLTELREELRQKHRVGRTLKEQLADAVAAEQYELAAKLRDQLAARQGKR